MRFKGDSESLDSDDVKCFGYVASSAAAKGKSSHCHQSHSFQMTRVSLDSVTLTLFASGTLRCANTGEKGRELGEYYCLLRCLLSGSESQVPFESLPAVIGQKA